MKRNKWVQIVILVIILGVGAITIGSNVFKETKIPRVGDQAPNFTLEGLNGEEFELKDFKGKVLLVNFWGTYCPPCVKEMPAIQAMYDKYKDQGFEVLGVNMDESSVTVKSFISNLDLSFPILMDKNVVRKQYGVTAYPSTFFVDEKGKIVSIKQGEMDERFLESTLSTMMSSKTALVIKGALR